MDVLEDLKEVSQFLLGTRYEHLRPIISTAVDELVNTRNQLAYANIALAAGRDPSFAEELAEKGQARVRADLLDEVKLALAAQCGCTVGGCVHDQIRAITWQAYANYTAMTDVDGAEWHALSSGTTTPQFIRDKMLLILADNRRLREASLVERAQAEACRAELTELRNRLALERSQKDKF